MTKERTPETEIGAYTSTLLRNHFGKGPTSVYVTIKKPYVVIHFRGFLSPVEKILLKQNEWKRVLETRDLLLNDLKPLIIEELLKMTGLDIQEFYADWNLSLKTGMFLGVLDEKAAAEDCMWPKELDQEVFHNRIERVNEAAERKPGGIESTWLSKRVLLVKRMDILVGIEKALIAEGYSEILKLSKRPLERQLLEEADLEEVLHRNILETFLDWNFDKDIGYIVFALAPDAPSQDRK